MGNNNPGTVLLLQDDDFREAVVKTRNSPDYNTWDEVRLAVNEEFDSEVSLDAMKNVYKEVTATSVIVSGPEKDYLNNAAEGMGKRLEVIMSITDQMSKEFEDFLDEVRAAKYLEPKERIKVMMAAINMNDKLTSSYMKQLSFVASQLKQITVKKDSMQWTEAKVHEEMQKLEPIRLKLLEDKGKIAIIDRKLIQ